MKNKILLSIAASVMVMAGGDITPQESVKVEQEKGTDIGIFTDVKYSGELRTRYEYADDSINDEANAITTRFALSVGADIGAIEGLSAFGQIMAVTNFGYDEYAPEKSGYAVIADPQNERVTQAYLDYKTGGTLIRVGRQMVNLDDQRFVGAVGWRQMPQTFMGYTVTNNSIENLNLMASYVTDRYGVTDALSSGTETVLLHADFKAMPEMKLSAYGYLIGSSSNTYGLMASGKVGMFNYIAEVATQQDASLEYKNAGEPAVDAMYFRGDISTNYNGFILGAAYESIGDADGHDHGFTTPLATLHKWQGFADVFLGYTAGSNTYGLNDFYAKIGYADPQYGTILAFYHNFTAQETDGMLSDDAGSEIDIAYSYKISNDLDFLAKAAFFSGESNSVISAALNDVTKYWVQLDYRF
ncbi:alginate export family protein [Sulfurovum sp. zt1-1]|uniref:Alginate export family protein n=1 Tax=Sulfurovum zhangzhouensis TaxID=3019067 RepID=A0ABT7QV05_9BACT|nr:alginate export family protein [Sulfurovum zhangzhouensis]MDM5270613.1 alginate export family protein [Sulfurovum zhangzhouensis]